MDIGLLLDNLSQPADSSYGKLNGMRATVVGTLWTAGTKHPIEVYEACQSVVSPNFIIRVGGHRQTSEEWDRDRSAAYDEVPIGIDKLLFAVGNEPNIEGWAGSPREYGLMFRDLDPLYEDECLFACPSLGIPGWERYLMAAVDAATDGGKRPLRRIAVNLYDHNVYKLPEVVRICTVGGQVPEVYVTELNTLKLENRPELLKADLDYLARQGVKAVLIFIAGGQSHGAWDERYIIGEDEAAALAVIVQELKGFIPQGIIITVRGNTTAPAVNTIVLGGDEPMPDEEKERQKIYARWAMQRIDAGEDPTDLKAFTAHLQAINCDFLHPEYYGWPAALSFPVDVEGINQLALEIKQHADKIAEITLPF